ncbi:MAG: hypothetical protein CFH41_02311 [Alphaproteobacteria bacterium MarineAlpha11_Bin1]|nr:MAG: hypothetical protein CFH41_02311 [Alphaproteobacteria bacterium MarineAlpha11_Bin1]|tara:strand:+ start:8019 stop:8819 length:801 start_codon:yes stop_codon:yes gene_type:complete
MINFTLIAKNEFEKLLANSIEHQNPDVLAASDIIRNMALISFTRFARSSSLYFSLNHALSTSIIGLHILNAMRCRNGVIRPALILNLMASVLFCNIGIVRGILEEDDGEKQKVSNDNPALVNANYTDSSMWEYKSFRSIKFIQGISLLNTNVNIEIVSRAIEYSDFFSNKTKKHSDVDEIAKYLRAIQVISLMSDQNYQRKLVEFYLSAKEANLIDRSIFSDLPDFREKWVQFFWERLYPDVGEEILLLRETIEGRNIVSQMYSHL